ncbi:hypothetical protein GC088_05230 [Arthrobacter sp. JZ12]|uniref:AMIN-like domain-containing (lipo)protein n=1 Tax=Arthrobacter sp. JZ12 TaxID=2654190 RepID=UPI002B4A47DE|nr:hypothetical protein [Arthrobacter sp. JZ12]WRH24540.1 hypothetical protein GC088_05230 [Arthrobacter sp. JZ12]
MHTIRALLASLLLIVGFGLVAPAPASAAPFCGITWGSLAKTSTTQSFGPVVNARAGRHACFDRLVIDVRGSRAGYTVRYVKAVVGTSGLATPLRGAADLQVTVNAPAYDTSGRATYRPANRREAVNVAGFTTFRQVAYIDSFEAHTNFGLGVRARLPFRVFTLNGPGTSSRLVIDVAHRW